MSPQRQCNANCAAPRKENTSKSGIELKSFPCKGQQQLISQVLLSDIRKKKNKNSLQTKKPWTAKRVQTNFGCVLPSQSPQNHPTDLEISKLPRTSKLAIPKKKQQQSTVLLLKSFGLQVDKYVLVAKAVAGGFLPMRQDSMVTHA